MFFCLWGSGSSPPQTWPGLTDGPTPFWSHSDSGSRRTRPHFRRSWGGRSHLHCLSPFLRDHRLRRDASELPKLHRIENRFLLTVAFSLNFISLFFCFSSLFLYFSTIIAWYFIQFHNSRTNFRLYTKQLFAFNWESSLKCIQLFIRLDSLERKCFDLSKWIFVCQLFFLLMCLICIYMYRICVVWINVVFIDVFLFIFFKIKTGFLSLLSELFGKWYESEFRGSDFKLFRL